MKLFNIKSTVLVTAFASGAASDAPALLRGVLDDAAALVEVQDTCTDGTSDGRTLANQMWKAAPYKSNCAYAFSSANPSIDKGASDLKAKYYPENTGNWQTDAFNQCARDYGVDPTVNDIKSNCFMNSDTCLDLGKTAASIIAYEYASTHDCDVNYRSYSGADYEQECRDVAISYCSGQVYPAVLKMCKSDMPTTTELKGMMDDCTDEVNDLVPPPTNPTKMPARKPTKMPTRKPTPRPIDTSRDPARNSCARDPSSEFCYNARRQCCSSAKKYNQFQPFCDYYGFPPKDGDDSMTAMLSSFAVDVKVDCYQCGQSKCPPRTVAYDDLELDAENFEAELDTVAVAYY